MGLLKKNHSFKPTGSNTIKEELRFPLFYLIAIVILWSDFSNRLGANGLRDISKVIMSQTFPPIVATLPNPTGSYCQKREIGPTLIFSGLTSSRVLRTDSICIGEKHDNWQND